MNTYNAILLSNTDGTGTEYGNTNSGASGPQQGYILPSSSSVSISGSVGDTETVSLNVVGDGALTVTSADSDVATGSVSGHTLTITATGSGSTTLTIDMAATSSYTSATATISVTATVGPTIVTFANGTDEQIKAMLDAYYADEITWQDMGWNVGDSRTIHLNSMTAPNPYTGTWDAQDIVVTIVAHDHTDLATAINGHTKACITVQTRECLNNCDAAYSTGDTLSGHIFVNGDSAYDMTFTKWSNLYMRTYMNSTILGAIPSGDFKSAIKQSKHYRHTNYNTADAELVTDTLFLPSYPEIFGTAEYANYTPTSPVEGTQFSYYETAANRIKYGNNNGTSNTVAQYWWEGSASSYFYSSIGYYWCRVNASGSAGNYDGLGAFGVAPAFAM